MIAARPVRKSLTAFSYKKTDREIIVKLYLIQLINIVSLQGSAPFTLVTPDPRKAVITYSD